MTKLEWINVDDRLPPKGAKPVLTYNGYRIIVAKYYRVQKRWIREVDGRWMYDTVTHWMPLPDPPKAMP